MRMIVITQYGDVVDPAGGTLPLSMMAACNTFVTKHPVTGEDILIAVLEQARVALLPWQVMNMLQAER